MYYVYHEYIYIYSYTMLHPSYQSLHMSLIGRLAPQLHREPRAVVGLVQQGQRAVHGLLGGPPLVHGF